MPNKTQAVIPHTRWLSEGNTAFAPGVRTPGRRLLPALAALTLLLTLPSGVTAARGKLPLGGDHGHYDGLWQAVDWLTAHAPPTAVIYHRSLGSHYRFYLYGRTGPDGYELRWFPQTTYLADNAAKTPHRRKFLIQPDWDPLPDASRRLAVRGVQWERRFRAGSFTVYELVLPPKRYCPWCACRIRRTPPSANPVPSWLHTSRYAP